eukprot:7385478-Prymnesium_polylepis.2
MTPSAAAEVVRLASSEPVGLGRPPPPPAVLEKWPVASPCRSKPMESYSTWLTACGRRVLSLINVRLRRGGLTRSADFTTAPTCTAEEPTQTSLHPKQTGCQSSPACRSESCAACSTLHLMSATASEPLSSSARPPQVWHARADGADASAPSLPSTKFVSKLVRERVNL